MSLSRRAPGVVKCRRGAARVTNLFDAGHVPGLHSCRLPCVLAPDLRISGLEQLQSLNRVPFDALPDVAALSKNLTPIRKQAYRSYASR